MTKEVNLFTDERVARYVDNGPTRFAPGYDSLLRMTALLLSETTSDAGRVLVVGAGGGNELVHFAAAAPGWWFYAVDPSPEMLALARSRMASAEAADRVTWITGYVDDIAAAPFDSGTCLMTLQMLPDDGTKLHCLRGIRAALRQGARFVLADNCIDSDQAGAARAIDRYVGYARTNGVPDDIAKAADTYMREGKSHSVSPTRNEALMREAGFRDIELVYAGLSWRGWCASA